MVLLIINLQLWLALELLRELLQILNNIFRYHPCYTTYWDPMAVLHLLSVWCVVLFYHFQMLKLLSQIIQIQGKLWRKELIMNLQQWSLLLPLVKVEVFLGISNLFSHNIWIFRFGFLIFLLFSYFIQLFSFLFCF